MTVKVELSHPLAPLGEQGPFLRIVVVIPYADNERLRRIEDIIMRRNAAALEGRVESPIRSDMDPTMMKKALSTVLLSAEQRSDPNLDIVTGIQIIQGNHRMFILEGPYTIHGVVDAEGNFEPNLTSAEAQEEAQTAPPLKGKAADKGKNAPPPPEPAEREGAILELVANLPRLEPNQHPGTKILHNANVTFARRLYGAFDADLRRIRLRKNLKELIARSDVSLETKYRPCSLALNRLWDILKANNMRKVRSIAGFPEVPMLVQLYKKYGDMLTRQDLDGVSSRDQAQKSGTAGDSQLVDPVELESLKLPGRPKRHPPTESSNVPYLSFLNIRAQMQKTDYVDKNIQDVLFASEMNRSKNPRPVKISADLVDPSVEINAYSCQTLTFARLHLDALRQRYAKDYGKVQGRWARPRSPLLRPKI